MNVGKFSQNSSYTYAFRNKIIFGFFYTIFFFWSFIYLNIMCKFIVPNEVLGMFCVRYVRFPKNPKLCCHIGEVGMVELMLIELSLHK